MSTERALVDIVGLFEMAAQVAAERDLTEQETLVLQRLCELAEEVVIDGCE